MGVNFLIVHMPRLPRFRMILFFVFLPTFLSAEKTGAVKTESEFWNVRIRNVKKKDVFIRLEVADTPEKKARGLMFRKSLPKNTGMIFIYERPQILSFWMKNTPLPLSIAFIDKNLRITEIFPMKPFDERVIRSTTKVMYAIEMPRGWFRQHFIYPGAKVHFQK